MQWNVHKVFALPNAQEAVDALFHRFGTIACQTGEAHSPSNQSSPFDEPGSIESCDSDNGARSRVKLNSICIRRMVSTFFVLYRHLHCWNAKTAMADERRSEDDDSGIKLHHILAASDDFSKLSMHWDLMPSAKLNYVHDFRGLFNCVSQVFFHCRKNEKKFIF